MRRASIIVLVLVCAAFILSWVLKAGASIAAATSTDYVVACFPFRWYMGRGRFAGLTRLLTVGAVMTQTTAGTGTVRVTSSASKPVLSGAIGGSMTVAFSGSYSQVEMTNTATSRTNVSSKTVNLWSATGEKADTWITVELKTTANTATLHGWHTWSVGALQ